MRRYTTPLAVTLIIALLITWAWAATVKIVVEGEDYATITPSMAKATGSTQASGGAYVQIPLRRPHATTETGPADTGNCVYKINVPSAGTYQLWARTNWYDGCGNSFFIIVDSNPSSYITDGTYGRWHWVKGAQYTLSAGQHTIRFQNREDGARLDQFLLTNGRSVPVNAETRTPQYIVH